MQIMDDLGSARAPGQPFHTCEPLPNLHGTGIALIPKKGNDYVQEIPNRDKVFKIRSLRYFIRVLVGEIKGYTKSSSHCSGLLLINVESLCPFTLLSSKWTVGVN